MSHLEPRRRSLVVVVSLFVSASAVAAPPRLEVGDACELKRNLKASAKTRGKGKKSRLFKGARVDILNEDRGWFEVSFDTRVGFIKARVLNKQCERVAAEPPAEPEEPAAPEPPPAPVEPPVGPPAETSEVPAEPAPEEPVAPVAERPAVEISAVSTSPVAGRARPEPTTRLPSRAPTPPPSPRP